MNFGTLVRFMCSRIHPRRPGGMKTCSRDMKSIDMKSINMKSMDLDTKMKMNTNINPPRPSKHPFNSTSKHPPLPRPRPYPSNPSYHHIKSSILKLTRRYPAQSPLPEPISSLPPTPLPIHHHQSIPQTQTPKAKKATDTCSPSELKHGESWKGGLLPCQLFPFPPIP